MGFAEQHPSKFDYSNLEDGDAIRAPLGDIDPVPWGNVRKKRDPEAFNRLRAAIRNAGGVTQGVTVRVNPDNPMRLQLLAGYGRVEAAKLEGFEDVPATMKVADDKQAEAIMLSENLDREALSIADEILAAQRFISYFDGNYEAAAAELNWSVKRLRGRLVLNQCTENVINALRDGDITLGHAEILSAFTAKLQDGTLEKIIAEKWSLDYLKERAGKANRFLKNAIFDTAECASCDHNSDFQAELFDNTVGKAKCNNLVCYKTKTDAVLDTRKAELEEQYGVVLIAVEKPASDRNTVSAGVVGTEQFDQGCTGCASNVAILQDGINSDAGTVTHNQCIDTTCFRKMRDAFTAPKTKPSSSKTSTAAPKTGTTTAKTTKAPSATKQAGAADKDTKGAVTQKTPGPVLVNNKVLLRSLSADHFKDNAHFMEAVAVATMYKDGGPANLDDAARELGVTLQHELNANVLTLYGLTPEKLAEVKKGLFFAYIQKAGDQWGGHQGLMITALANDPAGKAVAIAGWEPTKECLERYQKNGLGALAKASGFEASYDAANGEGAFSKVLKKGKGDAIKVLTDTEFDWSAFAPDDYLGCLV